MTGREIRESTPFTNEQLERTLADMMATIIFSAVFIFIDEANVNPDPLGK